MPPDIPAPRTLTDEQLARARGRAEHVIVLMLENRSFDHLLGFLDHPNPAFVTLQDGQYPQPYDLTDPNDVVGYSADAAPRLELDPPHGHLSAMKQLNLDGKTFGMNGFVAAYADKIAGREPHPKTHWRRIARAAGVASIAVVAPAAYYLARLGVLGGWMDFALPALGVTALTIVAVLAALGLDVPGFRTRTVALSAAALGFVIALAYNGWTSWADGDQGVVGWPLIVTGLVEWAVWLAWKRSRRIRLVPGDRVKAESAHIMRCMSPVHLPAIAQLAREYGVCTRWFSSVPGATWPNRNFAHSATSSASTDIEVGFYEEPTVFEALENDGRSWRVYHDGPAQLMAFKRLWLNRGHEDRFRHVGRLVDDITDGDLPAYSFVEPCHDGERSNSQHPGNNEDRISEDFKRGDELVATIYNALVDQAELFEKTVFVITYDEHGGFPDHVPPPTAPHPNGPRSAPSRREFWRRVVSRYVSYEGQPFPFSHLGPRVPTVVVSPWVYTIVDRKRVGRVDDVEYDHSSIVATLLRLFDCSTRNLTERDRVANDLLHLLAEDQPPQPPRRCEAYGPTERMVVQPAPPPLDPAAVDVSSVSSALTRDHLRDQLASILRLVRPELESRMSDDERDRATTATSSFGVDVAAETVPTATLFHAFADSTYDGNPGEDAF